MVAASNINTLYSNLLSNSGSTVAIWAYILDGKRDQSLFCKQDRMAGKTVVDIICFGMKNGYYNGMVYNETLQFDIPVQEGWNYLAMTI